MSLELMQERIRAVLHKHQSSGSNVHVRHPSQPAQYVVEAGTSAITYAQTLAEEGDRDVQQFGDGVHTACADSVSASLAFLKPLKGDAKGLGNLLLAQNEHDTAEPETRPDVLVYRSPPPQ